MLIASLIGPVTRHIGLVPTAVPTHTEPFHLASAIATLDYVSNGRAGWRPQVSGRPSEAAHVGFRTFPDVRSDRSRRPGGATGWCATCSTKRPTPSRSSRRLWDSWEDDAIIKDKPTGRYIDRDKLHYIDFDGPFFSVKGPSIVPRPPQGNPVVAALAHSTIPFEFAARSADVVFVTPADTADVARWVADVRTAERTVERADAPLKVFADLVVFLDDDRVDGRAAQGNTSTRSTATPYRSDAADLRRHARRARRSSCSSGRPTASTASGCDPA